MDPELLQTSARLGLAFLLGGVIGLERETHGQAAGLRTHMIVTVGAALITIISLKVALMGTGVPSDPGRIAAQIVSGIGFLGAGAIIRYGMTIRGLTTAACLWTSAGIGMACGIGFWFGACATAALTVIATFVFDRVEKKYLQDSSVRRIIIRASEGAGVLEKVEGVFQKEAIRMKSIGIEKDFIEKILQLNITVNMSEKINLEQLLNRLNDVPNVERVEIE
ncbi:MAG: MgtC/SapB family protein [Planctomycetota bacterium]|jgi:putative Mg2+ transporter-C (MgtC) family protein|nr:MgtC/SapB family protein [Planctomycetota bacterium]